MCERCEAIQRLIFKHLQTRNSTDDELAIGLLAEVIADLQAEKDGLHPNEKPVD